MPFSSDGAGNETDRQLLGPSEGFLRGRRLALFGVAALGLVTCSTPGPLPAKYVLGPMPVATATTVSQSALPIVEVERVQLPDYLDTTDILERRGNQLVSSETGRWGERLSIGMTHALIISLASGLPGMMVTETSPAGRPALQVLVDVAAFESRAEGQVVLVARWVVANGASRRIIAAQQTSLVGSVAGSGDSAVVAAMSHLVEELAAQLAASIQRDLRSG